MFTLERIDHVQLAGPKGCEDEARHFFGTVLGLKEIEKPDVLKKRGGVWFQMADQQLHIGIEDPFSPAKKAHPAFEVDRLDHCIDRLQHYQISYQEDDKLEGAKRIYVHDPFGNRLELLEWIVEQN
ncbi:hypothetical protein J416_00219 [Gracilibacillus halophilus YIM-C55.5]|uniref:VOC domain-containing protein n=1 Tax=Gracilibacillus halophilus YIM-C55.5 TaxID=1308866 RepID=N4WQF9_9BACI|nr:VOC family protein [Gracilibacillus halophilus]ENH98367.1 hypothetical protein J416_00219 [Gracilibacillus halophilus YIM-C55.5]